MLPTDRLLTRASRNALARKSCCNAVKKRYASERRGAAWRADPGLGANPEPRILHRAPTNASLTELYHPYPELSI
jgi:hypothetical protein